MRYNRCKRENDSRLERMYKMLKSQWIYSPGQRNQRPGKNERSEMLERLKIQAPPQYAQHSPG